MNQNDIVQRIATDTGLPPEIVRRSLKAIMSSIVEAVAENKRVVLRNFGKFYPHHGAMRRVSTFEDPKVVVDIPERKYVRFVLSVNWYKKNSY